jgi:hypothetical protein
MNHTSAINVWKGSNRVSQLWVDLLADRVPPDPLVGEYLSLDMDQALSFPLESREIEGDLIVSGGGQNSSPVSSLLEKAGFESLRLFRHALEVLTAPPEGEPMADTGQGELEEAVRIDPHQVYPALGMTFIKVSSEPEPQPGSSIDTRRMAYGLKIPMKPLHKRPVYQRVFFCLRHMIRPGRDDPSSHR